MPTETLVMLLKWLLIVAIWLLLAIDLYHDRFRIKKLAEASTASKLLYLLYKRNLQIYGLLSILLIAMAANDLGGSRQQPSAPPRVATTSPEPQPAPSAAQALSHPDQPENAAAQPAIPNNSGSPFDNITEFNEKNAKQQAYIDFLKERYETWLITYYYLQNCGKVANGDYEMILGSLKKELDANHADGNVEGNIITAATGSYKEMYSAIPCDAEHVNKTKAGYDSTMKRLLQPVDKPQLSPSAAAPATASPPAGAPARH